MRNALLIFCVALAAHLLYFVLDRGHIAPDTRKYVLPAESMIAGHGFARSGVPETQRTPGYSVVLAALMGLGLGLRQIALLQHLAAAAVAAALFLVARGMTGDNFVATVAGLITAIDFPTIVHANKILTETMFTSMALLLFMLVWRIGERRGSAVWQAAGAGLWLGAMTLVRPVTILFFIPLAAYLLWVRRDLAGRIVPLFVVSALLFPAAWIIRNHRLTGVATISTNSSVLLLDCHAAGVLAIDDEGDFLANVERRMLELRRIADARVRARLGISDLAHLPYIRRAAIDAELGREIVLAHPIAFARLFLWGIAANLLGGSADAFSRVTGLSYSSAARFLLPFNAVALLLAVTGLVRLLRTNRRLGVLILITIGYFIVFTAGALSYSRFRVPVVPMYSIAMAMGVAALPKAWQRFRKT